MAIHPGLCVGVAQQPSDTRSEFAGTDDLASHQLISAYANAQAVDTDYGIPTQLGDDFVEADFGDEDDKPKGKRKRGADGDGSTESRKISHVRRAIQRTQLTVCRRASRPSAARISTTRSTASSCSCHPASCRRPVASTRPTSSATRPRASWRCATGKPSTPTPARSTGASWKSSRRRPTRCGSSSRSCARDEDDRPAREERTRCWRARAAGPRCMLPVFPVHALHPLSAAPRDWRCYRLPELKRTRLDQRPLGSGVLHCSVDAGATVVGSCRSHCRVARASRARSALPPTL